jgi:tellurite resistance protein TerB
MALWDQLKSRLTDLQSNTKTQVGKYKSKDFAKASMAMCALIAAADGTISPEERRKTAAFIGSNDALSVFEPSELQQHFEF